MNVLICENKPERLGTHVLYLQKVFTSCTFDYAQDKASIIKKLEYNGPSYDLILAQYHLPQSTGSETYNIVRGQELNMPIVFYGLDDTRGELKALQAQDEDLFDLGNFYDAGDLRKVMDTLAARATA